MNIQLQDHRGIAHNIVDGRCELGSAEAVLDATGGWLIVRAKDAIRYAAVATELPGEVALIETMDPYSARLDVGAITQWRQVPHTNSWWPGQTFSPWFRVTARSGHTCGISYGSSAPVQAIFFSDGARVNLVLRYDVRLGPGEAFCARWANMSLAEHAGLRGEAGPPGTPPAVDGMVVTRYDPYPSTSLVGDERLAAENGATTMIAYPRPNTPYYSPDPADAGITEWRDNPKEHLRRGCLVNPYSMDTSGRHFPSFNCDASERLRETIIAVQNAGLDLVFWDTGGYLPWSIRDYTDVLCEFAASGISVLVEQGGDIPSLMFGHTMLYPYPRVHRDDYLAWRERAQAIAPAARFVTADHRRQAQPWEDEAEHRGFIKSIQMDPTLRGRAKMTVAEVAS